MFEHVLKALPEHIRLQNIKGTTQKKHSKHLRNFQQKSKICKSLFSRKKY